MSSDTTQRGMSEVLTEMRRERLAAGLDESVTHVLGDTRDLNVLGGETYDAALVMEPLYHLVIERERRLVLEQVFERLTRAGYCSRPLSVATASSATS